jgi:hypothetical protein
MKTMFARLLVMFVGLAYLNGGVAADARRMLQKGRKLFRLNTYGSEVYSEFTRQER